MVGSKFWFKPVAFNFKVKKKQTNKCRQFRRTCHSQGLKVPYVMLGHIHLTCNIRISMQLLQTIKNYHHIGNMTQHFIRLQMEGTACRCGG
jgi:hypothetical protein